MKLRITQPSQKDVVIQLDADETVLGRAPGCDVLISHSCVSKRHARLMTGVVVVDLGSSNGTTVDGQRISAPTLLRGRPFRLGGENSDVCVEVESEDPNLEASAEYLRVRGDLDAERRRTAALAAEVAALREADSGDKTDPETSSLVQDLRGERDDLARRLDSLREEIEARDVEASEGLQARLAGEALAEAKSSNDKLRQRVAELEAQASGPTLEATKNALSARVGELEADLAESTETVRRLRGELEERKAEPAAMGSELFFKLQAENQRLRGELDEANSESGVAAPDLFVQLQAENESLRDRIAMLEVAEAPAAPEPELGSGEVQELKRENHNLRMSSADLAAELEKLRTPAPVPTGEADGDSITALLTSLAAQDVDHAPVLLQGPLAPFVTLELFRFLRKTERLVTRMAGGFLQLFDQRTILPDTAGNVRGLLSEVLVAPEDPDSREEFVAYVEELGRWLVVAIGANRRAAERFAEELKSELSERNLTAGEPIPKLKKFAGMHDAALWQRAAKQLKRLTPDIIEERLEKLTSTCAEELRREQDR